MTPYFTAVIEKEDDMFVGLCPELDITSQDFTVKELTKYPYLLIGVTISIEIMNEEVI